MSEIVSSQEFTDYNIAEHMLWIMFEIQGMNSAPHSAKT